MSLFFTIHKAASGSLICPTQTQVHGGAAVVVSTWVTLFKYKSSPVRTSLRQRIKPSSHCTLAKQQASRWSPCTRWLGAPSSSAAARTRHPGVLFQGSPPSRWLGSDYNLPFHCRPCSFGSFIASAQLYWHLLRKILDFVWIKLVWAIKTITSSWILLIKFERRD